MNFLLGSQKGVTSPWRKGYVFFNGLYMAWKRYSRYVGNVSFVPFVGLLPFFPWSISLLTLLM